MDNAGRFYSNPYYTNRQVYNPYTNHYSYWPYMPARYYSDYWKEWLQLKDYGPNPFVINIEEATEQNNTFRTALWTGEHLQLTLMSINVGEDIGLEIHPNIDQFIRIEEGRGLVMMGDNKDNLSFQRNVHEDCVILIPAGTWHNLINTGYTPIKLYSIYAPPAHPHGTVHKTKEDAEEEHEY